MHSRLYPVKEAVDVEHYHYRGQPIGLVRGESDAQILLEPDEAIQAAIRAEFGSARRVWRWFLMEKLDFPHRFHGGTDLRWEPPSYHTIHKARR